MFSGDIWLVYVNTTYIKLQYIDIAVTECFIPLFYESMFHMNVCISIALSMFVSWVFAQGLVCLPLSLSVYVLCVLFVPTFPLRHHTFTLLSRRLCFSVCSSINLIAAVYLQSKTSYSSSYTEKQRLASSQYSHSKNASCMLTYTCTQRLWVYLKSNTGRFETFKTFIIQKLHEQ